MVTFWESDSQDGSGHGVETRVFATSTVAAHVFQGTSGADTLIGSTGSDTLIGGAGADTFQMGRSSGADTLDNRGHGTDGDVVAFGAGIAADQLWFEKLGADLRVSIMGEASSITLLGWDQSASNRVAEFHLSDGSRLLAGQVENLVTAMATMTPPSPTLVQLTPDQSNQLADILAANWQHS